MVRLESKDWTIDNVEAVIFDKDGTLVDLHYFWGKMTEMRANAVIDKFQLPESCNEKICFYLGYNINTKKMLSDGITALYSRAKIIEIFCERLKELDILTSTMEIEEIFDSVSEKFYNEIEKYTKPIDEAINFVKRIRDMNIKTAIVTSDSVVSTNLTLKQFGWENLFDIVIGRESTIEMKETGAPTKLALDKICADPDCTVMIGDAPMDYISAKNAGINRTILVATGQISYLELQKTSLYVLNSLKDLECLQI